MRTITLKLPDDLVTALEVMPEDERNHFVVAVLRDGLADVERDTDTPSNPEVVAELRGNMVLQRDAGGWRDYLDGQAVTCGTTLEMLTEGAWKPFRYEWRDYSAVGVDIELYPMPRHRGQDFPPIPLNREKARFRWPSEETREQWDRDWQ